MLPNCISEIETSTNVSQSANHILVLTIMEILQQDNVRMSALMTLTIQQTLQLTAAKLDVLQDHTASMILLFANKYVQ